MRQDHDVLVASFVFTREPLLLVILHFFCVLRWGLLPVAKGGHRIGLVLDCAIEDDLRLRHVQVL